MTAAEVLASLRARGVRVDVDAEGLRIEARPGLLTADDKTAIREHRAELGALVAGDEVRQGRQVRQEFQVGQRGGLDADPAPASPCGLCGGVLWWDPTWNGGAWWCPRCANQPRPTLRERYEDMTDAERQQLGAEAAAGDPLATTLVALIPNPPPDTLPRSHRRCPAGADVTW